MLFTLGAQAQQGLGGETCDVRPAPDSRFRKVAGVEPISAAASPIFTSLRSVIPDYDRLPKI